MSLISVALLLLSTVLSMMRNTFSKSISTFSFGSKKFFISQTILFFTGSFIPLIFGDISFFDIAPVIIIYALIYGVLLILTQWFYTVAMKNGNISICATIYSLGFVIPTLADTIFWNEKFNLLNSVGVILIIFAVIVSSRGKSSGNMNETGRKYIIPLMIAAASAGGLGVMQTIQQKSAFPEQKEMFVFVSFIVASFISLVFSLFSKSEENIIRDKKLFLSAGIGVCLGGCNILNTTLVGMLGGVVFFPVYNIMVIILSILSGAVIFKEKITKREVSVFLLGCLAILLLNLK